MEKKEHFTYEGMIKLVTLKSLNNLEISDNLKKAFPLLNISLIKTINYKFTSIPHGM